jgi:hypothetical protein
MKVHLVEEIAHRCATRSQEKTSNLFDQSHIRPAKAERIKLHISGRINAEFAIAA